MILDPLLIQSCWCHPAAQPDMSVCELSTSLPSHCTASQCVSLCEANQRRKEAQRAPQLIVIHSSHLFPRVQLSDMPSAVTCRRQTPVRCTEVCISPFESCIICIIVRRCSEAGGFKMHIRLHDDMSIRTATVFMFPTSGFEKKKINCFVLPQD